MIWPSIKKIRTDKIKRRERSRKKRETENQRRTISKKIERNGIEKIRISFRIRIEYEKKRIRT